MNILNGLLTMIGWGLMAPLSGLPPWVALVLWSAVSGVLMALAFRCTSNQKALRRAVDQIRANMLAMRLFKDDLNVTLRCQGRLFAAIGRRLWHSLPPMLVLVVPFVLVLTQLALWYEHRPLTRGQRAVVELRLVPAAWETHRNVALAAPEGVVIETPPVRDAHRHQITWRIRCETDRPFDLSWQFGPQSITKRVAAAPDGQRLALVSVLRPGTTFWERLLNPGEPAFDAEAAVRSIRVHHLPRSTPICGVDIPWWGTFLIVSMLAAFLSKPLTRVQF